MSSGAGRPDWLVELEDLANRIEHGLPLGEDDGAESNLVIDHQIGNGERPRLTLVQGGVSTKVETNEERGERLGFVYTDEHRATEDTLDRLAPLPTTRSELRVFCNDLVVRLGGDPVA